MLDDEMERAPAWGIGLLQDVRAGNVRWHQVRGELNAIEFKRHHLRERVDDSGLREARHAHQ
jgi:hypothetical protein